MALVGTSPIHSPGGGRCLAGLRSFEWSLHLVDPGRSDIDGQVCHASIDTLPGTADLAVLAVPADQVAGIARQCADRGFEAAIVFAAGYAEISTEDGLAPQHRLAAVAASGGVHVVGPNCVGIASRDHRLRVAVAEFGALSDRLTPASRPDGDDGTR